MRGDVLVAAPQELCRAVPGSTLLFARTLALPGVGRNAPPKCSDSESESLKQLLGLEEGFGTADLK
jgi:hypothetical protein